MELRELLEDTEYTEPLEEPPSPGIDWGTVGKGALIATPLLLAALALRYRLPLKSLAKRGYKEAFEKAVSKEAIKRGSEDIGLLKDATGKIIERPWTRMAKIPLRRTPIMPKTEVTQLFRRNLLGSVDEGVKVSKETIREATIALRKNGLALEDMSNLRYHGLQKGEGMRLHLFTLDKPTHPLHGSTIAGNLLGKKIGPNRALRIKSLKSKKLIIVKAKPQHLTHADIYADLPADLQNIDPKFIESGWIEKGKFVLK